MGMSYNRLDHPGQGQQDDYYNMNNLPNTGRTPSPPKLPKRSARCPPASAKKITIRDSDLRSSSSGSCAILVSSQSFSALQASTVLIRLRNQMTREVLSTWPLSFGPWLAFRHSSSLVRCGS